MNKEEYNVYMKNYMAKRYESRMQMGKDRLGGKCVICGTTDNLEFHHIIPEEKEFSIGSLWNMRLEKFLEEIDKCELRCPEHHKKEHEAEHGGNIRYRIYGCRCELCEEWWVKEKLWHKENKRKRRLIDKNYAK